jgi:hypothetical protein
MAPIIAGMIGSIYQCQVFKVIRMGKTKAKIDKGIKDVQEGVRHGVKDVQKGARDVKKGVDKEVGKVQKKIKKK